MLQDSFVFVLFYRFEIVFFLYDQKDLGLSVCVPPASLNLNLEFSYFNLQSARIPSINLNALPKNEFPSS